MHLEELETLDKNPKMGVPESVVNRMQAIGRDNTGKNAEKGHTANPRIEIKIPDPGGNRIRAARMEATNATNYAMGTNCTNSNLYVTFKNLLIYSMTLISS